MTFRAYKDASRRNWGVSGDGGLSLEQINTGLFQRMADALELIARDKAALIHDRDYLSAQYAERGKRIARLEKQVASLRGVITRMKRKAEVGK